MKFLILGYRGKIDSTSRIEAEIIKQGHELSNEPDVLVELCGPFDKAEEIYKSLKVKPKRIYCLLDIDKNKSAEFYKTAKQHLESADIALSISQTAATDIEDYLKLDKKLDLLPFPIRNIKYEAFYKSMPFLFVGRHYSAQKRINLAYETLDLMSVGRNQLVVASSEKPQYGIWVESPTDDVLSELYNSASFVLTPSYGDGLNLTSIEGIICAAAPIVCDDNDVVFENCLDAFVADPNPKSMAMKINEIETNRPKYNKIMDELRPRFEEKFNVANITKQLIKYAESLF